MSSVRCPACNLANWSTAITCQRCGSFLQPESESNHRQEPPTERKSENPSPYHQWSDLDEPQPSNDAPRESEKPPQTPVAQIHKQHYYQNYQKSVPQNLKSGLAIASMVLGILSIITSIVLIGVLLAPIGLILGIFSLVKINRQPRVYGGRGFAVAGIVTSSVIVLMIPLIAAIAIPNILAARRAAYESEAIATIRALAAAESVYMNSTEGKCGDVKTLIAIRQIDVSLAEGVKNGYRYLVVNLPVGGCELLATPVSASGGMRSFYYSTEDGVIRGAAKRGAPAGKNDYPLNGETPKRPEGKFNVEKTNSF